MHTEHPWYETWFDSPYYPILYKQRDETEAAAFIDRLLEILNPPEGATALDIACGQGRHARRLSDRGLDVTGLDLSENSIEKAKHFEHKGLSFFVHDMRKVFRINYFDYVFNLFTSFGYFEDEQDNDRSICAIAKNLKPGGRFVLDFMNASRVVRGLVPRETKIANHISFHIKREFDGSHIIKHIEFEDGGRSWKFDERVRALGLDDFDRYLSRAGLKRIALYGNYRLEPFDRDKSERLILIAQKITSENGTEISSDKICDEL